MKKVRYMTVPRVAIEIVSKLTTEEKGLFIDFLYSAFRQIEKGEPVTVPETNGIMEFAIEETVTELVTGYANYRQKMTAVETAKEKKRLKELKEMGINPDEIGEVSANNQRTISDTSAKDIRLDQNDKTLPNQYYQQNDMNTHDIEQIKANLVGVGYSVDEIERAINSVDDWKGIKNPTGYVRKTIDNERHKPKKALPAQNFPQRDYSDVNKQVMDNLAREMAEFKAEMERA